MTLLLVGHLLAAVLAPLLVRWWGRQAFLVLALVPAVSFAWIITRIGAVTGDGDVRETVPWVPGATGSMFQASSRYLKRSRDYRSVLGRIIRNHLGATQDQLNRIIPGYTVPTEALLNGGLSTKDATQIMGEPDIV